jgi:uncharacterized protein (TIGR03067 family)
MTQRALAATALAVLLLLPAAFLRADDPPPAADKDLEGEWDVTAGFRNGKDTPPLERLVYTFRGGVLSGDEKPGKYAVRADAAKTPRAIDLTPQDGPDKGKPSLGIYEVKGDVLRLCVAEQGKDRPTEFASKEGSNADLTTLKRVKK